MFVLKKKYKKDIAEYRKEVSDIELSRKRYMCVADLIRWQIGRKWMGIKYENLFLVNNGEVFCDYSLISNVGTPEQLFEKIKPILLTNRIDYIRIGVNLYYSRERDYHTMPMEKKEISIGNKLLKWFKEVINTPLFKTIALVLGITVLLLLFLIFPEQTSITILAFTGIVFIYLIYDYYNS